MKLIPLRKFAIYGMLCICRGVRGHSKYHNCMKKTYGVTVQTVGSMPTAPLVLLPMSDMVC